MRNSRTVKAEGLDSAIEEILTRYSSEVREAAAAQASVTAKEIAEELKATSPRDSGGYAQGWGTTRSFGGRAAFGATVYQRRKPGLTHLLEHGHAKRGGVGRVAARPHIALVADKYADIYLKEVSEAIRKVSG